MTEFDDQLSRSLADRAAAADGGAPDVYDVRRRVGRQRTTRRVVSGACALVLVAGAGVAVAVNSNGSASAPAAADGEHNAGVAPATTQAPAGTVPEGACGPDQVRTDASDVFVHHGTPYTLAAGQCVAGQPGGPAGERVSVSGCNVMGYVGSLPTTTPAGASTPAAAERPPPCLPADCTVSGLPTASTAPPTTTPPSTVPGAGGGGPASSVQIESGSVVVGSDGGGSGTEGGVVTCSSSASATAPAGTLPTPPSTGADPVCPDGQVGVSDGDVVLHTDRLFTPNAGQCLVATAQPTPPMVTCTAASFELPKGTVPPATGPGVSVTAGTIVASGGFTLGNGDGGACGCIVTMTNGRPDQTVDINGSIVAPSGTLPVLTTVPAEPAPVLSVGCPGPAATPALYGPAPTTLAPPTKG